MDQAALAIESDLESASGDFRRVIDPATIPFWQYEWRRNPELRALIRRAGQLGEATASRSKTVRGLWELSRTEQWRSEAGGRFPFAADFRRVGIS